MAGPAIRAAELARALARAGHGVTLAAPQPSTAPEGVALLEAGLADHDVLLGAFASHDVAVAQSLPPGLLRRVAALDTRLVFDLYNPTVVEVVEATRGKPAGSRRRLVAITRHAARAHLAAADLALCASERQAGLWRGLDPEARLAVVPFGVPEEPPQPAARSLLGVPPDARVLLWNGGVWDWLDAPTVIEALALLPDDVHLVFLGADRPALLERDRHAAGRAALAAAAGAERVRFLPGWVPYEQRGAYLLQADVVVSAHPATEEARFAFRTRLLDALWAARPIVCTEGDVLADVVAAERLGAAVPAGDPRAFAAAIEAVLADPPPPERIAAIAERYRWDRVVEPLAAFVASGARAPRREATVRRHTRAQYLPLAVETLASDGARAAARRIVRNAVRSLRRR